MNKDQLRSKLAQKEAEIRRLQKQEDRLTKDKEEAENWAKVFEDKVNELENELEILRHKDKLAREIIEAADSMTIGNCCHIARRLHDPITDWMQMDMETSINL